MPAIDEFSLTTVPIDLYFNEQLLSKGTAFTWERDSKHYLITNWHNVSGRNAPSVSDTVTNRRAAERFAARSKRSAKA